MFTKNKRSWRQRVENAKFYLVVGLIVTAITVVWTCTTNPGLMISYEEAKAAMQKQGYRNITVVDRDVMFIDGWLGACASGDDAEFEVTATNANGEEVKLYACGRLNNGFSVRTE